MKQPQLLDGQRPIIRSDGTLIRDYFYVKDGVSAYLLTAEKLLAGEAGGEAYNFSNEIQVTVRELVDLICRVDPRYPPLLAEIHDPPPLLETVTLGNEGELGPPFPHLQRSESRECCLCHVRGKA